MTNYIDEREVKQQPKGQKPNKKASGGSIQPHAKPGANEAGDRVPARKFFGNQGDFEDGTLND
jgi:hypothetical protein